MADKESLLLIQKLWSQTEARKLTWQAAAEEKRYETKIGTYRVEVGSIFDPDYPEQPDFQFKIFDENGAWVETITNQDLRPFMDSTFQGRNPYHLMEDIHAVAHKSALGVDRVVRDIIALLDNT